VVALWDAGVVSANDGIDFASSLAFGTVKRQRKTLYAVNFAIGPLFGFPPGAGPALLAIDAGVWGPARALTLTGRTESHASSGDKRA
jgi:hypothetical protein